MPLDQVALIRLRKALAGRPAMREVQMFGGVCFMQAGNMLCGTGWDGFMFRVGKAQHERAIERGARPMVQKGREMPGFVWVNPKAVDARGLKRWIAMAEDYVGTLPQKKRASRQRA